MAKLLSPLQLQAGAGLLQNQGLEIPPELAASISSYSSKIGLNYLQSALSQCIAANIANITIANLMTIASDTCPALADSIPQDFIVSIANTTSPIVTNFPIGNLSPDTPGLSGTVPYIANLEFGNGDYSKLSQVLSTAQGYVAGTNLFINSAVNAGTYLGDTFTTMDQLVTGDLTQVNIDTQAFGNDLAALGETIDLANLDNLGTPFALVQQVVKIAGLVSPLLVAFGQVGINENIVLGLNDPALVVTDVVQKQMYQAMTLITGDDLNEIKQILGVVTPNINTMADLLNPLKLFPTSYATITVPTCSGLKPIYTTKPGTVPTTSSQSTPDPCSPTSSAGSSTTSVSNPNVGVSSALISEIPYTAPGIDYLRLSKIIPNSIAMANRALAVSLGQLTNISRMSLAQLSAAFLGTETNRGLDLINAQTQPVSQAALDYYANTLASGSGPNGTLLLTDVIGTVIGTVHIEEFNNAANLLTELSAVPSVSEYLGNITDNYVDLSVNIIPGNEGAIEALINNVQANIINLINADPANTDSIITALNSSFANIGNQLQAEGLNQDQATLVLTELTGNSRASTQTLVLALPSYGLDTTEGGIAYVLEQLAPSTYTITHTVTDAGNYTYALPANYVSADVTPVKSVSINGTDVEYTVSGADIIISGTVTLSVNDVIVVTCDNLYGQSVVATLRQGRTQTALAAAGIATANEVEGDPKTPPPQATLSPSTYGG